MENSYKNPILMNNAELLNVLYDATHFKLCDIERECNMRPSTLTHAKSTKGKLPSKHRVAVINFIKQHIYGD